MFSPVPKESKKNSFKTEITFFFIVHEILPKHFLWKL